MVEIKECKPTGCSDLAHSEENATIQQTQDRLLLERKYTIPEAAKVMGIGTTSLRRIIAEGRLPVLNILHKMLILESDLASFLREARVIVKQAKNASIHLPSLPECVIESEHLK